jgi:hypothetical protein
MDSTWWAVARSAVVRVSVLKDTSFPLAHN